MNIFDLIIYLALAWAVFNGWRRGFLLQLVSLVAMAAGLFLALKYGVEAGAMLGLSGATASVAGFIALFLAAIIVVTLAGHLLRAVLRLTGLGAADVLLGVLLSVLKVGLVVSFLFSWFAAVNVRYELVDKTIIEQSRWFEPTVSVVDRVTPFFTDIANEVLNK